MNDNTVYNEGVGVVVRVRPLSTKERADARVHNCIQCLPESIVIDGSNSKARGSGATRASRPAPASQPVRATTRPYQFSVDQVFHTHASQIEVYEQSCKRIVEGVFHGINGSILAYGATGSGKTHTMFGSTMSAAGIVYQAVQDIFAEKDRLEEEEGKRVRIKCSFLEVYNEDVFDLLAKPAITSGGGAAASRDAKRVPLQVREVTGLASDADSTTPGFNTNGGLHIQGLTHIFPETLEEFARGIEHGHTQRFVAATDANAQSSRSHAIITVEVEVREGGRAPQKGGSSSGATAGGRVNGDDADDGTPQPSPAADDDMADPASPSSSSAGQPRSPSKKGAAKKKKKTSSGTTSSGSATAGGGAATAATPTVTIAKVQFADLAGSERAAATNNTGTRLREGGNINRSLLALGAVVQSLALQKVRRQQTAGKGGSKIFVPYRGSKLTRLLRDSIGGNCRTQMLFCLSPSTRHIEEAVNTMKFAMNAKEIQVVAYRNEFAVNSSQLAKTQEAVIDELREELALTRARLAMLTGEEGDNSDDDADAPEQHRSEATVAVAAGKDKGQGSGRGVTEAAPASPKATRPAAGSFASSTSTTGPSGRGSPSPTSSQGTPAAASLGAGLPPPLTGKGGQRGTLTPSAVSAAAGGAAAAFAAPGGVPPVPGRSASTANNSRASMSPRAADGPLSTSSSLPRPSVSSRTARPSVFAENTPLFSELEARLKNYSAQKESLYHEVRDAQERERDGDTQLREQQWRLATFLVSNASSSRLRGEVGGDGGTAVGVAGLRTVIAGMESSQAEQAAKLTALTARLDDVDRQFDATRQELLRERQGTALELLLDNTRLRQGCTEAECLAAHYHQECRSLFNREAEYADALSKCIEAIHRLRPFATHAQLNRYANSGNAVAAAEAADVALLYALLPTTTTAQMMPVFESALRSAVNTAGPAGQQQQQHSPPSAQAFVHPPLAPSPTNRPGAGGGGGSSDGSSHSPVRGGGSVNGNGNHHLAEHFRDLVATAESLNLTGGDRDASGNGADGGGGVRTRHGYLPSPVATTGGMSGTAADPRHGAAGAVTQQHQQQQHTPGRKKEKARQRSTPGAVADPSAYGRTISPTGLTRGPTGASRAVPGKKRAGTRRKKSGGGGTGAAPAAATARSLQRSLSAPTSFTRSASSTENIAPAELLPRRLPTGLTARTARSISGASGAGGGGTPSRSATSDSAVKKASVSSPRRGPARGSVGSPRGIAFVRSNTAATLRAQASMNGSASSTGGSAGASRTSDGAEGGLTGPRKLSYGGVSGSGNKFTTTNTTVSYTTANGFGRTTGATPGSRKGAKHNNSSSGAGGAGASPPSTATSNRRRLTRSLTTSSISTPKRRSAASEDTGFSSQPDYTGGGTPTMTASLSRLSSSSSMNVSCESGLDRTNGGGGSAGHGSPDRGQGQRASPGSNVSGGAAGGGSTASPLTVARLLECSTTPLPSLPRYSSIEDTPTHSPAVKDGSAPLPHRHGQPSSAPLSRRKGSLADDLTVSRSTCASDAQSPNSRGLVSSPSY